MPIDTRPIAVDLFSGAGGMSCGFEQAGFNVAAAFDYNPRCVEAHQSNFPACVSAQADLAAATGQKLRSLGKLGDKQVDVLFGGPPCGGFSVAGRRNPADPRNKLLLKFASFVEELHPSYFVVENVRGLLMGDAVKKLKTFTRTVEKAGYEVVSPVRVLNAADFGVPQNRQRVFILGYRKNLTAPLYPEATTPEGHQDRVVVGDAINDLLLIEQNLKVLTDDVYEGPLGTPSKYAKQLVADVTGENARPAGCRKRVRRLTGCMRVVHSPESVLRYKQTEPGSRDEVSRLFRLSPDSQSPTLRAGTDVAHGSFTAVRPIHYKFARCITTREAARIHSFPDWFQFHPTKWHGFMQIGNAVPPLLAAAVARSIIKAIRAS